MSIVKFSEVAHRAYTREDRFNTEKIYYVGGEHIDSCELYVTKKGVIKGSTIGPMFYCGFTAGQILFVTRNPHLKKCSIADFDGICSEKTFVIETKDESILTQEYLAIIMQSDDFWNYCEENKSGGVNYFLNWSTLADYEFELPPIKQQLEIAQKVMSAYRLKQSYKKLLDATREMVKSQFIEMFG
ncbi:MAG: restriction endonuclease subunit S, partial [Odoribacter splanchnicus]